MKEEVGEGDAQQLHGQFILGIRFDEPGSEHENQNRSGENAERAHQHQDGAEHSGHAGGELSHFLMLARLPIPGQHRHEGLRKRSLREQPAQKIGEPKGDEKGVGLRRSTEGASNDDVAQESEHP